MTSAIIGPRTMEQLESQLPAAGLRLGDDVLDVAYEPRTIRHTRRRRLTATT